MESFPIEIEAGQGSGATAAAAGAGPQVIVTSKLDMRAVQEVGDEAAWTLSSAKPTNGIDQLRDGKFETFWQSDGTLPHSIAMQFPRRMALSAVCLYLDSQADESYTPEKITVRAGTTWHDLEDIIKVELQEPVGWVVIPLRPREDPSAPCIRAFLLVVEIHIMQQNGRDTHVRQVRVLSPRSTVGHSLTGLDFIPFETPELRMYAEVR